MGPRFPCVTSQSFRERGGVIQCVWSVKPMVLDLEVDPTLGDGFCCYCFFYSQKELGFTKSYLQLF